MTPATLSAWADHAADQQHGGARSAATAVRTEAQRLAALSATIQHAVGDPTALDISGLRALLDDLSDAAQAGTHAAADLAAAQRDLRTTLRETLRAALSLAGEPPGLRRVG